MSSMEHYINIEGKSYKVGVKKYLVSGRTYRKHHAKLTVATDFFSGKQIQRDYTGNSVEEVEAKIRAAMGFSDIELNLLPYRVSVSELFEEWCSYKSLSCSKTTITANQTLIRNDILPWLGEQMVQDLTGDSIRSWQHQLKEQGTQEGHIFRVFSIFSSALNYAKNKGYIAFNPARYVAVSSRQWNPQGVLHQKQLERLLIAHHDHVYANLYAFILLSGLRKGEALGLSWDSVDLQNNRITVRQVLLTDGSLQYNTKNKIERTILLPKCAMVFLHRQLEYQRKKEADAEWNNAHNLVFTQPDGKALRVVLVTREFREMMQDTFDEQYVSIHSLRRTVATVIAENLSFREAVYYLGHSDEFTTMQYVYPIEKGVDHVVATTGKYYSELLKEAGILNGLP